MNGEIAFKVLGIELVTPDNDPGCYIDLGRSPESLEKAARLFSSRVKEKDWAAGNLRLHVKNEENGEIGIADFSLTEGEMFLTVPA